MLSFLKRYDEALQDLDKAVALLPNFHDAYQWRGDVRLLSGAYRPAFEDFQTCLSLKPENTVCQLYGMQAAFLIGDFAAAARLAQALPADYFHNAPLYSGLAKFAAGDLAVAESEIKTYTKTMPDDPYGWLWLTLVERRLGKDAPSELKGVVARRDAWPMPVLRHLAGLASAEAVLAAADVPDPDIRTQRIAEANYYLGELAAIAGDTAKSKAYMAASVAAGYADIDPLKFVLVYKSNDAVELSLATASLKGGF